MRRAEEVRRALGAGDEGATDRASLVQRAHLSLAVALAAAILAVALDLVRRSKGTPSSKFAFRPAFAANPWIRGLVPGWYSTSRGRGIRALLAIVFPAALILVPMLRIWGYRVFLGFESGPGPATVLCFTILAIFFGARLVRALKTSGGRVR